MEYIYRILLEDPYDDITREAVCEILIEDLLSQFDVDGTVLCTSFFRLVDIGQQQQQFDTTTTANTTLITILPTNTNILPTPNTKNKPKIHTQPKDRQVQVILNNNSNKKKEKPKKVAQPKTRTPSKTTHKIKRPTTTIGIGEAI